MLGTTTAPTSTTPPARAAYTARMTAARDAHAAVERVDDRDQRQRQEQGDDDEAEDVAQQPREVEREGGYDDDRHDAHDAPHRRSRQAHRRWDDRRLLGPGERRALGHRVGPGHRSPSRPRVGGWSRRS